MVFCTHAATLSFIQKANSCQAGTVQGVSGQYILSSCFNQDPLENYFGNLRSRGGWCDNPSVKSALESAQSLRVQGSLSMMPIRGNSILKASFSWH